MALPNLRLGRSSLTQRLLWVLISSLTALAILLGVGGSWFIKGVAEQTADRVLKASARAIAETLAVEEGEITLDLPPAALGMLEDDARDNIYYNISYGKRLLTGYPDFPKPQAAPDPEHSAFRYDYYRGVKVRVVTEARRLPRTEGLVVVQVAETLDERTALARRMLVGLIVLEGALVGFAALLVWPAVRWSLRPVTRLRTELETRSRTGADFAPLETRAVPAELQGLVGGFNGLLSRLENAVVGMRRFTADASHQMRTPLTILRTHLAVLREQGTDTPQGQASMNDVEAAVDRLRRLLTQLIALARAEESAVGQSQFKPFRLDEVAAEAARAIAPSAISQGIELHFDSADTPLRVRGNPVLASEIVTNLLENAIQYNRPGGNVTLRLSDQDGVVRLSVDDDGPGIPAKDRERVFQRFHRLARDQQQLGSGLGLPIVKTLAQSMNASVELAEGPSGRGLSVGIVFQRAA